MISYEDILASLISKIRKAKKRVKVVSDDISEGFERPSFKIKIDNIKIENFMNKFQDRRLKVKVYYFPKDRNKNQIDLLNTMDELTKGFIENNYIQFEDGLIVEIENQNMFISEDKVLHLSFEVFISEEFEEDLTIELMEELEIGGEYVDK